MHACQAAPPSNSVQVEAVASTFPAALPLSRVSSTPGPHTRGRRSSHWCHAPSPGNGVLAAVLPFPGVATAPGWGQALRRPTQMIYALESDPSCNVLMNTCMP